MSISSFSITQKMIEGTVETVLLFSSVTSIIFLDNFSPYFNLILQVLSYSKSKSMFLYPSYFRYKPKYSD